MPQILVVKLHEEICVESGGLILATQEALVTFL
jgi:hypothetical protein